MPPSPEENRTFNLKAVKILVVEAVATNMDILVLMLAGFGAKTIEKAASLDVAKASLAEQAVDLVIVGDTGPNEDGAKLVDWMRREALDDNKIARVLIVSGHTPQYKVEAARDSGANIILARPLTPAVLLERVLWVLRRQRDFIVCDTYVGPDRRFKSLSPLADNPGRRKADREMDFAASVMAARSGGLPAGLESAS